MRVAPILLLLLGFAVACAGTDAPSAPSPSAPSPSAPSPSAPSPSAPSPAAPSPAAPSGSVPSATPPSSPSAASAPPKVRLELLGSAADAAVADRWLVILASERDPATRVEGAEALRRRTDVATNVRQLNSGRFKNLMPCYAITIADALPDKAAALALSKQLQRFGIDNYVKNAGAWTGPSGAIDAYCDGAVSGVGVGGAVVLASAGERLWAPLDAPEAVVTNALRGVPAPRALGTGFEAWHQPVSLDAVGAVRKGDSYRAVDATSGALRVCTVTEIAALTLGAPHFGALQGGAPKRPACGEAKLYAALACDGPVRGGHWLGAPAETALLGYTPAGAGSPAQVEAGKAALTRDTDWTTHPADFPGVPATREVTVGLWEGPEGTVALVQGTRTVGDGVCGGDEQSWAGLFRVAGGTLGAPLGVFLPTAFGNVVGVVDARGDGLPELVTYTFPSTMAVTSVDGTAVSVSTTDYCDCPC